MPQMNKAHLYFFGEIGSTTTNRNDVIKCTKNSRTKLNRLTLWKCLIITHRKDLKRSRVQCSLVKKAIN